MANMSYCRFRNTLEDLRDCYENWDHLDNLDEDDVPNEDEIKARKKLLSLCEDIAEYMGDD